MKDVKIDACRYLLTLLLQRLEGVKPGFIAEITSGVKGDMASIESDIPDQEHVEAILAEALLTLGRAAGR